MQTFSAIFAISFVLLTVTFHEGLALHCWRCSSDSRHGELCTDPFTPENFSESDLSWAYAECKTGSDPNKIPVCKKTVQNINDKVVVKRSCGLESRSGQGEECKSSNGGPSFVKTVFCETCRKDGCNGYISTDYTALADEFPANEIKKLVEKLPLDTEDDMDEEDDDAEGGDEEDNDIGKDASRRGNLVTKPEHQTEEVYHAKDPELMEEGNAADNKSLFSVLALVSVALLANYF